MVDKACGGEPERLVSALLDYRGLTDEEAERIRKMLSETQKKPSERKKQP